MENIKTLINLVDDLAYKTKQDPSGAFDKRIPVIKFFSNYFLLDLVKEYNFGKILINPDWQRRLVWNNQQKSMLIESFLLNTPVPPVYFYKVGDKLEILDGVQRITTLINFFNSKFNLSDMKVLDDLEGQTYDDFSKSDKIRFDRINLDAVIVAPHFDQAVPNVDDENLKISTGIFERINTSGEDLEKQEIRHARYPGKFNEALKAISQCKVFTEIFSIPDYEEPESEEHSSWAEHPVVKRMEDCEIVLRFFTFLNLENLHGSMQIKDALTATMRYYHSNEDLWLKYEQNFRELYVYLLNASKMIFEDTIFRNPFRSSKSKCLVGVYDAAMISLAEILQHVNCREYDEVITKLCRKKENILSNYRDAFDQENDKILKFPGYKGKNRIYQNAYKLLTATKSDIQCVKERVKHFKTKILEM